MSSLYLKIALTTMALTAWTARADFDNEAMSEYEMEEVLEDTKPVDSDGSRETRDDFADSDSSTAPVSKRENLDEPDADVAQEIGEAVDDASSSSSGWSSATPEPESPLTSIPEPEASESVYTPPAKVAKSKPKLKNKKKMKAKKTAKLHKSKKSKKSVKTAAHKSKSKKAKLKGKRVAARR